MRPTPRIALIHATRVAIDPIETAARKLWPEAEIMTILEEGLSIDRQKSPEISDGLSDRILGLTRYASEAGADGILFTCSAFGEAIERAAGTCSVPVLKPNEAMFDEAFEHGDRIALLYSFSPAASGMEMEFEEAASERNSKAKLTSYFVDDALDAKRDGNDELHDQLIAAKAATIQDADAIMLGQFSMASAAERAQPMTDTPVLASPDAAIWKLRRRVLANQDGTVAC